MTGNAVSRKRGMRQFNEEAGIILEVLVEATKPAMEAFSARAYLALKLAQRLRVATPSRSPLAPALTRR
jgi:hypothetical protein